MRVADNFGKIRFKKFCKPLLCNEVDQSINNTHKYPLFLHAPTSQPLPLTPPQREGRKDRDTPYGMEKFK